MAFAADTVVVFDPVGGSNNNGGGFAASDGGARITSPIAYDDLVIDAANNTKIHSAGDRAFVANDAGNWLNVMSGTGWTVQWARIVSVAAGVATMDRSMGTVGSTGGTGNLGGYLAVLTDALGELAVAGMEYHVWATGTMTLTGSVWVAVGGATTAPCRIVGKASDGSANPTGDNRPLIAAGGYAFRLGAKWEVVDIRVTSTDTLSLAVGQFSLVERCKITNSSTTTSRDALNMANTYCTAIDCELQSDYGRGIVMAAYSRAINCYLHDCTQGGGTREGITAATVASVDGCIIDTCTVGINAADKTAFGLQFSDVYNCDTGLSATTAYASVIRNNILSDCGTALSWTTATTRNLIDWNNIYNSGTADRSNVAVGPNDFDADPGFTDAANGDFSIPSSTPNGRGMTLGVG